MIHGLTAVDKTVIIIIFLKVASMNLTFFVSFKFSKEHVRSNLRIKRPASDEHRCNLWSNQLLGSDTRRVQSKR